MLFLVRSNLFSSFSSDTKLAPAKIEVYEVILKYCDSRIAIGDE